MFKILHFYQIIVLYLDIDKFIKFEIIVLYIFLTGGIENLNNVSIFIQFV